MVGALAEPEVSGQPSLRIHQAGTALVDLAVSRLQECFEQAIPRRIGVDLPPTA